MCDEKIKSPHPYNTPLTASNQHSIKQLDSREKNAKPKGNTIDYKQKGFIDSKDPYNSSIELHRHSLEEAMWQVLNPALIQPDVVNYPIKTIIEVRVKL